MSSCQKRQLSSPRCCNSSSIICIRALPTVSLRASITNSSDKSFSLRFPTKSMTMLSILRSKVRISSMLWKEVGCCQVVSYNFSGMGQPWFSEFIAERRAAYTLAQFPNFGIWGETDFQGTYYTNYQSYTTGWWTEYIMYNGCGNNIAVSSVDSTSTFSESWQTSCGTY